MSDRQPYYVYSGDIITLANYRYFWPNRGVNVDQLTPDCSPFMVTYNDTGSFVGSTSWSCCYCHCPGSFAAGLEAYDGTTPTVYTLLQIQQTPQVETQLKIIKLYPSSNTGSGGTIKVDTIFRAANDGDQIFVGDLVGLATQVSPNELQVWRAQDSCTTGCDDSVYASFRTWQAQNICSRDGGNDDGSTDYCAGETCSGDCGAQTFAVHMIVDIGGFGSVVSDDDFVPYSNVGKYPPLYYGGAYFIQNLGKRIERNNGQFVKVGDDANYKAKLSYQNVSQLFGTDFPEDNGLDFTFRIYNQNGHIPMIDTSQISLP